MKYIFEVITGCSLLSILYALIIGFTAFHEKHNKNNLIKTQIQQIAHALHVGTRVYVRRQSFVMGGVCIVMAALLALLLSPLAAISFSSGTLLSTLAGFIGTRISIKSSIQTAWATHFPPQSAYPAALRMAFEAGIGVGFFVTSLALLSITAFFWYLTTLSPSQSQLLEVFVSLSFGASLHSIFTRLGGGIFAKGADAGADIVEKIERGIFENDLRNPAVIAGNVGNNVGNCAGIAADVFETYVMTFVGTMVLATVYFQGLLQSVMMLYPLLIGVSCLIGAFVGTCFIHPGKDRKPIYTLYRGLLVAIIISAGGIVWATHYVYQVMEMHFPTTLVPFSEINLIICAITGLGITGLLMGITNYHTSLSHSSVRDIAKASVTGHATNIIQGLAMGMEATILPTLVIVIAIIVAYFNAGIFGISVTVTAMLSLSGIIVAMDVLGSVTDNAKNIAKMAKLPQKVQNTTDLLTPLGSTAKAVTKSYAIGGAGLAAFVFFIIYAEELRHYFPPYSIAFKLTDPFVLAGLLLGGLIPCAFGAMALKAVGRASSALVLEVRRQLRENPRIIEQHQMPNYKQAVDLLTKVVIREMAVPALLPVLTPVVLFSLVQMIAGQGYGFSCLGAIVIGTIFMGLFTALSMTSAGSAWENAKKLIEAGDYGGKRSYAHLTATTGGTVGDHCKDTAGVAMTSLIKIVSIVVILLLASLGCMIS